MSDKIQEVIDRYLDRDQAEPDEIDDVLAEYTSQHASERLRRARSPKRAHLARRASSLTIVSPESEFQAVAARLQEDERLALGADGHTIEIISGVEEDDEEVEGQITVLRD